jgi:tetratricopeptide (TPR) repeat protein
MKHKIPPTNNSISELSTKKHLIIISLLLSVITLIVYFQVTQNEFINFDDDKYITNNKHVQNGLTLKGITWAFTTGHESNWHPLTWISHMIDVQLFGLNPGGHHLMNLLIHLANTVLLFLVLNRMTKALWQSAFVAALFALHPLRVESVAWAAERKDVLSAFFWILTMGIYVWYVAQRCSKRYLAALLCFALGLMAKPMLVTLPFVLLLLDYWPLGRLGHKEPTREEQPSSKKKKGSKAPAPLKPVQQLPATQWSLIRPLLIEKIPFLVLTLLSSIITYIVQAYGGAVSSLGKISLSARISNAFVSYIAYIKKMVWPMDLAVLYPHPMSIPLWEVLGSAFILIVLSIQALRKKERYPFGFVGWFWYTGTLIPVVGIIQVGSQSMADRYTYVPLIGLSIIITWGLPELIKSWSYRKQTFIILSALFLFGLSLLTWQQVGYWRNSIILFDHTLAITNRNLVVQMNRGNTYLELGNYQKAILDYDKALELDPKLTDGYINRGIAYSHLGNFQQAVRDYDKAIELAPKEATAYFGRGMVYGNLGNDQQAIRDIKVAAQLGEKAAQDFLKNAGLGW